MLRSRCIILLITLFGFIEASAVVAPPDLRCVSVAPNGDVTLSWIIPTDASLEFNNYQLFKDGVLLTVINTYSTSTYTDVGAGANTASHSYFIKTSYGAGPSISPSSDTLRSMFLALANLGGVASLSWNAIHNPNLPSSTGVYKIYREYPVGVLTMIGTTTSTNYKDTIRQICSSTLLNYYVAIDDQSGCTSTSNIEGKNFYDQIPPPKTFIKSVSVDPLTGVVTISWYQNTASDTKRYIIYSVLNNVNTPIDTVYGISTTSFVNTHSKADSTSEYYDIATLDSCNETGNLSDSIHRTIFVSAFLNRCDGSDSLVWNRYHHMPSGVSGYTVYVSINGGAFSLAGSTSSNDTTFTHTGLISGNNYCYYVEAVNVNGDIVSTSNETCKRADISKVPAFLYLRKASVSGTRSVTITGHTDVAAGIKYYVIKRLNDNTGIYDSIGQLPYSATPTVVFDDTTAQTNVKSYYYKLEAVDSCGRIKLVSNIGRTIYLSATADLEAGSNLLAWNEYELWLANVSTYNIYRSLDGVFNQPPLTSVSSTGATDYTYTDDITNVLLGEGNFYYNIEAIEGGVNSFGFRDTSLSNIALARHNSFLYVPSAFTPGDKNGLNDIFMPVNTYLSKSDYSFEIFDRWGERIFSTNNHADGWNGTYHSGMAQQGVYVYKVAYKDAFGNPFEKKGTVTLVNSN